MSNENTTMSNEDKIIEYWMENHPFEENAEFDLEVPYNHYGSRGVVDCVVKVTSPKSESVKEWVELYDSHIPTKIAFEVWEIKSEYAVESATGANEILRQFKSHQQYFFKGTDEYGIANSDRVKWILAFEDTPKVREHIRQNYALYDNIYSHDVWVQLHNEKCGFIPIKEVKDE